jgi:hypothetical protein
VGDSSINEGGGGMGRAVSVATVVFGLGGGLLAFGRRDFAFDGKGDAVCTRNS